MAKVTIRRKAVKRPRPPARSARIALTRERVFQTAMDIADKDGLAAVTMRRLGQELGVEAMSLYHHVRDKGEIEGGMIDAFISRIEAPPPGTDWREAIRGRAMSARRLVRRHRWAPRLLASRQHISPVVMRYNEGLVGAFHDGGFSNQLIHTAMHVVSSRSLGFTQDLAVQGDEADANAHRILAQIRIEDYPVLKEALKGVMHDEDYEFVFGLDLILDGLERARDAERQKVRARR